MERVGVDRGQSGAVGGDRGRDALVVRRAQGGSQGVLGRTCGGQNQGEEQAGEGEAAGGEGHFASLHRRWASTPARSGLGSFRLFSGFAGR